MPELDRDKFLAWLLFYQQVPYAADGQRLNPVPPIHPTDCSGYQWLGLHYGCGVAFPPAVSSAQAKWCYDNDGETSVEVGIRTAGQLLFMGPDRGLRGFGSNGHVACSLGDGRTIETPAAGHASGVRDAHNRNWTGAGRIPGMRYVALDGRTPLPWPVPGKPPTPVPAPPPPITVEQGKAFRGVAIAQLPAVPLIQLGSKGIPVGVWQQALNLAMDISIKVDGDFGRFTHDATVWLQTMAGLRRDGVVGQFTKDACVAFLRSHP